MEEISLSLISLLAAFFFVLGIIVLITVFTGKMYAGGKGTEENPYLVKTAKHLDNVRNHLDAHFKQVADINLSGFSKEEGWKPIGDVNAGFRGSYNGNEHKIQKLVINRPAQENTGLFGCIEGGNLENIGLEGVQITGKLYVGALAGDNKGTIKNSYASGKITGVNNVGGLAGVNSGTITNCHAAGEVTGDYYIGGLVGANGKGVISNCCAQSTVSGNRWLVGGLVGENIGAVTRSYAAGSVSGKGCRIGGLVGHNAGAVSECYASGEVEGANNVGGLAGYNNGAVTNSYSLGSVSGQYFIGGLVGAIEKGSITNCYAVGVVSGAGIFMGLAGVTGMGSIKYSYYDKEIFRTIDLENFTGRSGKEMKQRETFTKWDFENIWNIEEEKTYPWLRWQGKLT